MIQPDAIRKLMELDLIGIYGGFPDLMLYKEDQLKLVEVKSRNDRLTWMQIEWFRQVQPYLGIPSEIWHIDAKK